MGFRIRKSVSVGPLRFNLSKSGIGISAGIRGLRIGTGPRGNYVSIGSNGVYYRQTIPTPVPSHRSHSSPDATQSSSHGPMQKVAETDVSQMTSSSSENLIREIRKKHARFQLSLVSLVVICILGFPLFLTDTPAWAWICTGVLGSIVIGAAVLYDLLNKSVVILYELDSEVEEKLSRLYDDLSQLGACGGKWRVIAEGDVHDRKYHAGAGKLIDRKPIQVSNCQPPFVRANVPVIRVKMNRTAIYLLPQWILVYTPKGIGALTYDDLEISSNEIRFIESGGLPHDATVVDRTWQYVNKNGGPDRRFKNNRELPICLYEEIYLRSSTGLNEILQASRTGIAKRLRTGVKELAAVLQRAHSRTVSQPLQLSDEQSHAFLILLFCVIAADGRASRAEKKQLFLELQSSGSSWSIDKCNGELQKLIVASRGKGIDTLLSLATSNARLLKLAGLGRNAQTALMSVAAVDNETDPRTSQVVQTIWQDL